MFEVLDTDYNSSGRTTRTQGDGHDPASPLQRHGINREGDNHDEGGDDTMNMRQAADNKGEHEDGTRQKVQKMEPAPYNEEEHRKGPKRCQQCLLGKFLFCCIISLFYY
jgi:hypothetical protein